MLLFVWSCIALIRISAALAGHVVDSPTAANFLRRKLHASVLLGDFVYIDGGEIAQLVDGTPDPGQGADPSQGIAPGTHQNNVTLSIDLRVSWTNRSLPIKTFSKGSAAVLNFEELWRTADGRSSYVWGGAMSRLISVSDGTPPPVYLWKLSPDLSGGGVWSQESLASSQFSSKPAQFHRPELGCSATIADTSFYIGGIVSTQSDPTAVSLPGTYLYETTVTSFNSSSGLWGDEATASLNSVGTSIGAKAVAVPAIGLDQRALIFVLGGWDPGFNINQPPTDYVGLDNVTLYDPYIERWYSQKATGDIPAPRGHFCAVAMPSDNGTYEIFIYGGILETLFSVYDNVYVLSIPGFVWFKSSAAATGRCYHTCEHVGGCQLMSIGGIDNTEAGAWDQWAMNQVPDPLVQGIGIFNMASMTWKSSYEADPSPYTSPQVVKDWYSSGGQATVEWQSLEIARMFIRDTAVTVNPTPPAVSATTEPTATSQNSNNDSTRVGLGVGLAVGLFGTIAGGVSAWFAWKMYRLKKA